MKTALTVLAGSAVVSFAYYLGLHDAEPAVPKVIVAQMPVVAPPGPNAEPELPPMNQPAPAPVVQAIRPVLVAVATPEIPAEQEVPTPTAVVTTMMKKTYACSQARVGGAEEAVQRIVARDGTISAAQMEALRLFEARCLSE